jgi:hypothetical protein
LTCSRCNNYDETSPSSVYIESMDETATPIMGVFALVANETDPKRQCQFMSYCQAANKIQDPVSFSQKFIYNCTKCLPVNNANAPVVRISKLGYGKAMPADATTTTEQIADKLPQCILKSNVVNPVENCVQYYVPKVVTPLVTLLPKIDVVKLGCLACDAGFIPEYTSISAAGVVTGGTYCKPQNIACNIGACKYY